MPQFIHNSKVYYNPVEYAMDFIGGTWKIPILWRLKDNTMRYSQLKKSIHNITDKMLTTQLRELESNGFINRKVFPVVPPHTEYSLTEKGKKAIELIKIIRQYGIELMEEDGIDVSYYK